MGSNEHNPSPNPSNPPLLLDFTELQMSFPVQPEDKNVINRNALLESELSYLKVYNVSVSKETFVDYFSKQSTMIGRGSFGIVFRVDYPGSTPFAFKRIKLVGARNDDEKKLREIDISKALYEIDNSRGIHPNVVRTYYYCIDFDNFDTPWINLFMELCEESLLDWFKKTDPNNPRSYALKKKMFLEICEGLKNIHGKSILHRDLKPENILLNSSGTCKIADFGLSRLVEGQSSIYITKGTGTPIYSAPEKITTNQYDSRADIFPLGCIWMEFFFEFYDESEIISALKNLREIDLMSLMYNQNQMKKTRSLPPMIVTNYPEEGQLIMKMTSHQPEERPSIDEVIATITALNR